MSVPSLEIKIVKPSKTFHPGDTVQGFVIIQTKTTLKHEGLELCFEGLLSTQKNIAMVDTFSPVVTTSTSGKPTVIIESRQKLLPGGKLNVGKTELPFKVELKPGLGQEFLETYHGIHVLISYVFKAELKRSMLQQNIQTTEEIFLEIPGTQKSGDNSKGKDFSVKSSNIQPETSNGQVPNFSAKGLIRTVECSLTSPIRGSLKVESSELPITSIDLTLHRVESTVELSKPQKSDIMSLQIADGDVMHGVDIPIKFVIPRYFTCPSTTHSMFSVSFQMSANITFTNGFMASEVIDLEFKRYK